MKKTILTVAFMAIAITLSSCSSDSSDSNNYAYKVRMTDTSGLFSEVNVDIQAVEVKGSYGQTVLLNTNAGIYNLLDFTNGIDTLIATSTLRDFRVSQIRLILGSNNSVVLDKVTYPFKHA